MGLNIGQQFHLFIQLIYHLLYLGNSGEIEVLYSFPNFQILYLYFYLSKLFFVLTDF